MFTRKVNTFVADDSRDANSPAGLEISAAASNFPDTVYIDRHCRVLHRHLCGIAVVVKSYYAKYSLMRCTI